MKTLANQYKLIKEDKGHKGVFLKEAKRQFPNLITNAATFKEASTILKQKGIIAENYVDLQPINNPITRKKEGYEDAFAKFLQEAETKAEEKKVSKEVEEDYSKNYNMQDDKNPDNMIFGQIQMGVYYEAKLDKNEGKTLEEIKDMVYKNLAKDPIYYTKNGQFGVDVGYTDEAPSLGATDEPKGKYKSSGYGKLKENKILKEAIQMSKIELVQDQIRHLKDVISGYRMISYYGQQGDRQFWDMRDMDESPAMKSAEKEIKELEKKLKELEKNPANKEKTVLVKPDGTVEPIKKPVNEIAIAGGLVTGGGFTSQNYMDFYGLHEENTNEATEEDLERSEKKLEVEKQSSLKEYKMASQEKAEALLRAAEEYLQEVDTIDDVIYFIESNLETQESDI